MSIHVVLICLDKAAHEQVRLDNRAAHLKYVESTGKVVLGGPFLGEGAKMNGSMLILSVENIEEAKAWADEDPYAKAGLFESVTMREWKKTIG